MADPEPDSVFVITAYELDGKALLAYPPSAAQKAMTKQSRFPKGWDEARVKRVVDHYESQSEAEAIAEDEAALRLEDQTLMEVPNDLVPIVRELIAKQRRAS